jgi:hypothetical protein
MIHLWPDTPRAKLIDAEARNQSHSASSSIVLRLPGERSAHRRRRRSRAHEDLWRGAHQRPFASIRAISHWRDAHTHLRTRDLYARYCPPNLRSRSRSSRNYAVTQHSQHRNQKDHEPQIVGGNSDSQIDQSQPDIDRTSRVGVHAVADDARSRLMRPHASAGVS